jgi:hypothetical protein
MGGAWQPALNRRTTPIAPNHAFPASICRTIIYRLLEFDSVDAP